MAPSHPKYPAALAPGTVVGSWRVVSRRGQGSYGVIYRVQRAERPESGFFALKLALHPMNERFEREVELLSRLDHPHVPRLHDSGWWTLPEGTSFPYLVMDWVEGLPLYAWAERRRLTSRQAMRLVAQLARGLEALHGVDGVHRDVKGDNTLVTEEGRAVLADLGSGHYRGARVLTRQQEPPGTPRYQSPEAQRFQWRFRRRAAARYEAQPADDVYALGMTAWRLVTGRYPPLTENLEALEDDTQSLVELPPEALGGVYPELAALICRMLSNEPSARGSAGELAQALEQLAKSAGRKADRPIQESSSKASPVRSAWRVPVRQGLAWGLGLAAVVMGLVLALSAWEPEPWEPAEEPAVVAQEARAEGQEDAGTSALVEAMLAARVSLAPPVTDQQGIALDMPKEPLPGQRRPPCGKYESAINGGCWGLLTYATPPCGPGIYEWKDGCYVPTFDSPRRPPTSEQP